jgi:putative hydrolase of HD superfamily
MKPDSALALLLRANQLKLVPRTGWMMRGVPDAESVSDHTFGVAFIALVLAQLMEQSVDVKKLLTIALIHDLPEAVLSDIPSPASRHLPPTAKTTAEGEVLHALLDGFPSAEQWEDWWRAFEDRGTIEGKLVRDADRLDMLLQAYVYEQTTGNRRLEEFWADSSRDAFACQVSQSIFDALRKARREAEERA